MTMQDELARALERMCESADYMPDDAADLLKRYAATKAADNGTTHFDQCWRDRTHHACAVAKIEELQAKAEGAQAPVAWLYRAENGDIYEMLGGNDQAKFMRRYADDDRDWISLDEFNTMQPITTAPQSLPDSAMPNQVRAVAFPAIERDESYERDYIPIGAGYEVQTKGRGSSFRIAHTDDKNVGRINIQGGQHEFAYLEKMARAIHAERSAAPPAAPSDGAMVQAVRALFENPEIAEMACIGSIAPVEHDLGVLQAELAKHDEHRAREIAEGKK